MNSIDLFSATDSGVLEIESKLHESLMKGYQKDVHPIIQIGNKTEPVSVVFDAQVIRILEVVIPYFYYFFYITTCLLLERLG